MSTAMFIKRNASQVSVGKIGLDTALKTRTRKVAIVPRANFLKKFIKSS